MKRYAAWLLFFAALALFGAQTMRAFGVVAFHADFFGKKGTVVVDAGHGGGGGGATGVHGELEKDINLAIALELQRLLEQHQFELVDVEYVKEAGSWYLRAYIDKEGGITVDDCETISRILSDWLDKEDFIEDSYILEVSSPGLGRPLKKDKDFERSLGAEVELRLYKAREKQKEFAGILKAYDKDTVTVELEDGSEMLFARAELALIRLAFDF